MPQAVSLPNLRIPKPVTMTTSSFTAVILAAGMGTRMKSSLPKVMNRIGGLPMLGHVLKALAPLEPAQCCVVVGPGMDTVSAAAAPHPTAIQHDRLGTADAVKAARNVLGDGGDVKEQMIFGDSPFLSTATLADMITARESGAGVVVLGFRASDPTGYGRLVLGDDRSLDAIVEHRDATEEQRKIDLCNSGVMAIEGHSLFEMVDAVQNNNAKGEYYLTDIVAIARSMGKACMVIEADESELMGIDSKADLAVAEKRFQAAARANALEAGVTMHDPETVWFSHDTQIGLDVEIEPHVVFRPGVTIGDAVTIKAFCHLEGATVHTGATIGPFARLRPGADIGNNARVGNFVEIKNATLAEGAKANHLSYIGDATVGAAANIGAGTITCNYDGYLKSKTEIGAGAFIGSNTALVAPVTIGDGAIVGAGSTITEDVAKDAIASARGTQVEKPGAAARFRDRRRKLKAEKSKSD